MGEGLQPLVYRGCHSNKYVRHFRCQVALSLWKDAISGEAFPQLLISVTGAKQRAITHPWPLLLGAKGCAHPPHRLPEEMSTL